MINRRDFLKYLSIAASTAILPTSIMAATGGAKRVIVVGGGYAGSTCAKYLKMWGGSSVDVVLIEPNANYVSPILSNLVLNSQKSISDLTFSYAPHVNKYKINVIHKSVTSINANAKSITLNDGTTLSYDRLVLAPGIDFIKPNNYDFNKIPHAWIAGAQTQLLKAQIDTLQSGDTFVMTIPKAPYRCPPGPYERACVVADYLKNAKGLNVNIIVLDENADFTVEKATFSTAFNNYGIQYISNAKVTNVDDVNMQITYNNTQTISAKVINVIPNQKAAKIVIDSGLTDSTGFAPVNLLSYESTKKRYIHIIGDSHKSKQPKAGHIGNNEAKICADAILRLLNNQQPFNAPKTNSACYSPISRTEASWLAAVYRYDSATGQMVSADSYPRSGAPSARNYRDMFNWSGNLFSDTFM